MKITTYIYLENEMSEIVSESVTLKEALEQLKNEEIHFFHIIENDTFIEITLSDDDEVIIN